MTSYRLTKDAENDLRSIARYTLDNHGSKQLQLYRSKLEAKFLEIAEGTVIAKSFSLNIPEVLVTRCEHHFVFFLSGNPAIIIAILHEKMDMISRLGKRLDNE